MHIPSIKDTLPYEIDSILKIFKHHIDGKQETHLGYPYNLTTSTLIPDNLLEFAKLSLNNLGDPFVESNYGLHSRQFEIAVLDWFADLWHIPRDEYWGYIGCSGTEGNFEGILLGRESLPPDAVLYASEESHYSVFKAARMFKIPTIVVKSNPSDGSINVEDFQNVLDPNKPALININIGTTMKGGIDNYDKIIEILKNKSNNVFYIHCDGALSGIIADPGLTFEKSIHSISVSGHKFLGCPFPSGVIITRKNTMLVLSKDIDYINSRDATIMGSRNGHSPLFLWYILVQKGGIQGLQKEYMQCSQLAKQLACMIPNATCNQNTVVFKNPGFTPQFIHKWQLACSGDICHIVVMPNITIETLNKFVKEYISKCNFELQV